MGVLSFLTIRLVELIVVLLLFLFMPNIPPTSNFSSFKISPTQNLEGKLALNDRLDGIEHLYQDELKGPETFAEYNGELYTTIHGGDVVKLSKGQIVPVVKFGKPCTGYTEESICGRPLGMQFDQNGNLHVADAYMGVWKVDVKTGQKTLLVSMDKEIEGKKPRLPNSLVVCKNGDVYWTDSSSEFALEDGLFTLLADGTGRLIHYDARTKTNKVLMDGLHFANGVFLSSDEDFIVVAESGRNRLYRFYLKGPKKGTHDIFADGLPGMPDNLKSDGQGGLLVPLVLSIDSDNPMITQVFGPFPLIRKLVARILSVIELSFKTVDKVYPNVYAKGAVHWIGHFESSAYAYPPRKTILHMSKTGEILDSIHTNDKSFYGISDAFIFNEYLYIGSPFNPFVGRILLTKVGLEHLQKKRSIPEQQKTTSPPTTVPVQKAPPTAAPVKQTPPPTKTTSPPPTAAPTKQTNPPTKQTAPPTKQTAPPTKQTAPPTKQTAPPTQQTPPPKKQTSPPSKQTPPPSKQTPPLAAEPKAVPTQAPPVAKQPSKPAPVKEAPKVVPVKENSVPKTESIHPMN